MARGNCGLLWYAALALSWVEVAAADMIVLSSTAPNVQVNRELKAGTRLDIPAGASVTLLDIDGNRFELSAPGGIVPGEPSSEKTLSPSSTLIDALYRVFAPEAYNKILGTRGLPCRLSEMESSCVALSAGMTTLLQDKCCGHAVNLWRSMQTEIPKQLFIGTSRGAGVVSFRAGESLHFEAQSNFDGYLYCFHEASDGTTTRIIPLAGDAPRLNAHAVGRLPGSLAAGQAPFVVDAPTGRDRIKCYASAYELALWFPEFLTGSPTLGSQMLDAEIDDLFADSGRDFATAELLIDIRE